MDLSKDEASWIAALSNIGHFHHQHHQHRDQHHQRHRKNHNYHHQTSIFNLFIPRTIIWSYWDGCVSWKVWKKGDDYNNEYFRYKLSKNGITDAYSTTDCCPLLSIVDNIPQMLSQTSPRNAPYVTKWSPSSHQVVTM